MFILRKDRPLNTGAEWDAAWIRYQSHLDSISKLLPSATRNYAFAEWHYNHLDHRAPHDSWLEKITTSEVFKNNNSLIPSSLTLTLLGAYHDLRIEISYDDVHAYRVNRTHKSIGDWLYDEITINQSGRVVHEIEFENGEVVVECADMVYQWEELISRSSD
jgi:hypothetical protein